MSWTKDEERLLQYLSEQSECTQNEMDRETYWEERDREEVGIEEYGFETFQEVQQFLLDYTEDSQIALIAGAAAIRGKALYHRENKAEECVNYKRITDGDIPDFVYIF